MIGRHRGGEWAVESPPAGEVFTPEDLDDFQLQSAKAVRAFMQHEVYPAVPAMEAHDFNENVRLLRKASELGITGLEIPECFGGSGLDKVTAAVVVEQLGTAASFSTTFGAHTGIGTLPIVYFGSRAQKEKYLPALATAEKVAAYSLTEPTAGSDALGARTTARLSQDGQHWILNGAKQWTTNGGIADIFIVYAKVDGTKFSAFIVERDSPGFSTGQEERKMGLNGSSTRSVILQECTIPVDNLLFEVGKGHQIAFNILNIGRYKLGVGTLGGAKQLMGLALKYAGEREQFGRPIGQFPLIQQKLAEMALRIYGLESACYRTAALLEEGLGGIDLEAEDAGRQSALAIHEYAVECSIVKVLGSEVLDYVADEAVQIHGGYGFMEEYEVCRAYRDSRINRIFEGTNEINRLVIAGELLKKVRSRQLPLLEAAEALQRELPTIAAPQFDGGDPLDEARWLVDAGRKLTQLTAGAGVQKYQAAVEQEQEVMAGVGDMLIDVYAMESAVLRAQKYPSEERLELAQVYAHDAFERVESTARRLLPALSDGADLHARLAAVRKLARRTPMDTIALKRRIARRIMGTSEGSGVMI